MPALGRGQIGIPGVLPRRLRGVSCTFQYQNDGVWRMNFARALADVGGTRGPAMCRGQRSKRVRLSRQQQSVAMAFVRALDLSQWRRHHARLDCSDHRAWTKPLSANC